MWLLSKNAGFCCLFGAQVSAAYALTEGDASGPAQTLLAADTESDSDPDSGIATLPDLTEEHPVTLQPDEEPAPSDDASSGTQVVYYADPSDPDELGDADTDVEIDPDGVDFGRYITKSEAQWRKNKNDSWHSWDELAGGALGYGDGLKFRLEYTLPTGSLWKNGTGQPDTIIFYQLPETLKNFTGSDKVYADHVAVGEYEIRDGVVTIHFTDMDYIGKSKESDIKGTIELSGTVSQLKADDDGKVELDFNKDVRFEMTVKPKPVDLSIVKKGIQKDVANNKITYQVTVSTEEGTQGTPVLLHDALQLNLGKALVGAKYDENSLKVSLDVEKNGNDKIYENTAPEGETANGWSVKTAADGKSFDLTLPALEAGESYTISGLISKSGEWHTDHTITWTVKLNQNNADLTGTVLRDFFGGTDEANELKNQEAKMKRVAPGININDVTSVDVQLPYYFGYKDGIKNGTSLGSLDNAYYEFSYTTPDTPMLGNGNAAWNRAYLITGDSVLNFDAASLKITHPVGDESGKQIEQTLKENIDYTLKKDCEDGCAFEITFSDERLTPGDLLTLTYSATVREDAVVEGEGNPNTTWLEYADPTGSSTTGEEETRTVVPEEPKVPEQPSEPKQPPVIPTPIDPSEVPEEPAGSDSREEPPASPDDSLRPGAPGSDNQDGWVLGAHGTAGNPAAEAPADSTAAAPMPDNHKNKVMGAVDSLIQTGQLNWPIPVLLTLGGALVLAGLVLTRRKNRR